MKKVNKNYMSGGHFNYQQHNIKDIANELESIIQNNRQSLNQEDNFTIYNQYEYSPAVIQKFYHGLVILRLAYIYTREIDLLLCGDTSEDSFLRNLEEEINKLNKEYELSKLDALQRP